MGGFVASKVWATVSDQLSVNLDKRATEEGRSKSDLISYLLERSMDGWQGRAEMLQALATLKAKLGDTTPDVQAAIAAIEKGLTD
ncbi:hypothetical protein SPB21_03860 [Leptothoe sp. ISB3NOV94-8A]